MHPQPEHIKRILTATVLILAVFAPIFFGQLWMITLLYPGSQ
jgi:phosphatidate cytidylyltransferase